MVVTCPQCGKNYDDTYRLTYCPHNKFDMATSVYRGGKFIGIATTVEQLNQMMEGKEQ